MTERTCSVEGCPVAGNLRRGWCFKHYMRWRRHGSPEHVERVTTLGPPEDRFWAKVDMRGPDECWLWTASRFTDRYGYGKFNAGTRQDETNVVYAHRFAYALMHGPIPDGMQVLHSCDAPPCVNPQHLRLGTPRENTDDKMRRGRYRAWHNVEQLGYVPKPWMESA